jgi:hypothetical protein
MAQVVEHLPSIHKGPGFNPLYWTEANERLLGLQGEGEGDWQLHGPKVSL